MPRWAMERIASRLVVGRSRTIRRALRWVCSYMDEVGSEGDESLTVSCVELCDDMMMTMGIRGKLPTWHITF